MQITRPFSSPQGDNYLIRIGEFNKSMLPDFLAEALQDVEILDVTLERIEGNNITSLSVLLNITKFIADILKDNENSILYFYCNDIHDIPRRQKHIKPQHFRSILFSKMFERYVTANHIYNFVNTPIKIIADRDIYIHFISRTQHLTLVDKMKEAIVELSKQ